MADLLGQDAVVLDAAASSAEEAIRITGDVLVRIGAVDPSYVDAMLERELTVSTFMGEGVAIPHGTNEGRSAVRREALSFVRFPEGVDWNGHDVRIAIGIAATGDQHVGILSRLATTLVDPDQAARLRGATDTHTVLSLLQPEQGESES